MPLHPTLAAMVEKAAALPPMVSLPIATIRSTDATRYKVGVAPDEVAHIEERLVPGPTAPIRIRIYRPDELPGHALTLFFHGGGFVVCSLDSHDDLCRQLCRRSGSVVVSVDYRLAPEHRFPAAPDDCLAATRWAVEHAAEFGADPARLALAGDSAGGNLAAVTALRLRDEGGPVPRAQLLLYPVTDHYSVERDSYRERAVGFGLTRETMRWFWDHYLETASAGEHPHASPQRAASLAGLPPAYVLTAEYDPLRDEGEAYARRLAESGVTTTLRRSPVMNHGFLFWVGLIDEASREMDAACAWLKQAA
ncbi:MAG: alpha/beta hydrolase [Burkholderiales bacterium]|nr:alpha/beta hydrolase [Burkholderiales bacterium]MDE2396136.1 alpha/beta hydrolase [Burkholderiales bacterium]MDE2457316.1 alpha/beta hydrolase [Burkholderiales bacterium]